MLAKKLCITIRTCKLLITNSDPDWRPRRCKEKGIFLQHKRWLVEGWAIFEQRATEPLHLLPWGVCIRLWRQRSLHGLLWLRWVAISREWHCVDDDPSTYPTQHKKQNSRCSAFTAPNCLLRRAARRRVPQGWLYFGHTGQQWDIDSGHKGRSSIHMLQWSTVTEQRALHHSRPKQGAQRKDAAPVCQHRR